MPEKQSIFEVTEVRDSDSSFSQSQKLVATKPKISFICTIKFPQQYAFQVQLLKRFEQFWSSIGSLCTEKVLQNRKG